MESPIDRAALNARMSGNQNQSQNSSSETKMVALASGSAIRLWAITDDGLRTDIGALYLLFSSSFLFIISLGWIEVLWIFLKVCFRSFDFLDIEDSSKFFKS